MQIAPELLSSDAWRAATDARREAILDAVLAALPDFELAYINSYSVGSLAPVTIATLRERASGILFNLIPGGTFEMGFSERQADALRDLLTEDCMTGDDLEVAGGILEEPVASWMRPVRTIQIRPFLLARFPLRCIDAARILGLDPEDTSVPRIEDLDVAGFPEEKDVENFLAKTGYRLPGEAEWEYACRAGSDALFWWGDRRPLFYGERRPNETEWAEDMTDAAAADRYSNRFGLVNLGAYPELCEDLWHESLDGIPADGSPWLENPDGSLRVLRGDAALSYPWQGVGEWVSLLSSWRSGSETAGIGIAVRLARSL